MWIPDLDVDSSFQISRFQICMWILDLDLYYRFSELWIWIVGLYEASVSWYWIPDLDMDFEYGFGF
jgi:hypothetical protein